MATEAKHPTEEHTVIYEDQRKADSRAVLALEGMTCASCAMRIEKGLKKVPGVADAQVNLATEQASVTYDPARTDVSQMMQKVEAVGYKATPVEQLPGASVQTSGASAQTAASVTPAFALQEDERTKRKQTEIVRKRNLLILGIVLSLPVVILSMFFIDRFPGENYFLLALKTLVWALVGWDFHGGAINTLRPAGPKRDPLVCLAS